MIRAVLLTLLLAGCASSPMTPTGSAGQSNAQPASNPEVHRGLLTNQKSSPDSGQSPGGDGRGGGPGL